MKKITLIALILAILALAACKSTEDLDKQVADDSAPVTTDDSLSDDSVTDAGDIVDNSGDSMDASKGDDSMAGTSGNSEMVDDSPADDGMMEDGDVGNDTMPETDDTSSSGSSGSSSSSSSSEESISGTLIDLAALGRQIQCDYEDEQSKSTVYVSGDKFRSDGVTKDNSINVHTINDGDYVYIWSDAELKGTKISLDYLEEMSEGTSAEYDRDEMQFPDTEYSFDCRPWVPQQSYFDVPAGVEFIDMQEMIGGMMEQACAQCDKLEGDQKAQCLQMMNC